MFMNRKLLFAQLLHQKISTGPTITSIDLNIRNCKKLYKDGAIENSW